MGSIFTSLWHRAPAASHQESQREDPSCLHSLLKKIVSPLPPTLENLIPMVLVK